MDPHCVIHLVAWILFTCPLWFGGTLNFTTTSCDLYYRPLLLWFEPLWIYLDTPSRPHYKTFQTCTCEPPIPAFPTLFYYWLTQLPTYPSFTRWCRPSPYPVVITGYALPMILQQFLVLCYLFLPIIPTTQLGFGGRMEPKPPGDLNT